MTSIKHIGIILALMISATAWAEETPSPFLVNTEIALSTNTIYIGDPVKATLTVQHPKGSQIDLPDLQKGKEIRVRDQHVTVNDEHPDYTQTMVDYTLTSFDVGNHVLSSGIVAVATSDGELLKSAFPFALIEVKSALTNENANMHDIKDLATWPGRILIWVYVLILVIIAAALVGILAKHFLNKPRTILHMPPPPPAHETALQALNILKAKGWIEALNIEPFYIELSDIVRHYIEARFDIHAPEQTTEEFIRETATSNILSMDHQSLTQQFLEQCDLVKFARYRPEKTDMTNAYDSAERLVQETIPRESITPQGGAS